MKFSRKHYIAIAEVLADTNATDYTVDKMRDMFVEDNSNFDSDRFREFICDRRHNCGCAYTAEKKIIKK